MKKYLTKIELFQVIFFMIWFFICTKGSQVFSSWTNFISILLVYIAGYIIGIKVLCGILKFIISKIKK